MDLRRFKKSFNYAFHGLKYVLSTQQNVRIHLGCTLVVLFMAWYFAVSRVELLILLLTSAMVLVAEIINTAIETTINYFTGERQKWSKIAKDVAAASVLVTAILAIIIGVIIFWPIFYHKFFK